MKRVLFLLPRIDDAVEALKAAQVFATLDLTDAYQRIQFPDLAFTFALESMD